MMSLLLLLVFFAILTPYTLEVEGSASEQLYHKWAIGLPTVSLGDKNTFTVDYDINDDLLTPANVRTKIMTEDCMGPQIEQGVRADYVATNGNHVFQLEIQQLTTNQTITTISEDRLSATMKLCLKYSLWSGDEEYAVEINNLYNILTVYMRLEDDYATDIGLNVELWVWNDDEISEDDDEQEIEKKKKLQKEKHILRCYLCHPVTHVPTFPPIGGYGLGDVLSICSEASQSVIDDNMFLKGVDNFLWRRTVTLRNGEKKIHEQWAVKDGVPDALSTYHCPHRALFCTFTTMLNAEFFMLPGVVEGIGSTALKFGEGDPSEILASADDGERKLIEIEIQGFDYAAMQTERLHENQQETIHLPSMEEEQRRQLLEAGERKLVTLEIHDISQKTVQTGRLRGNLCETNYLPSMEAKQQRKLFDESEANMFMSIPVRGPRARPKETDSTVLVEEPNTQYWLVWLAISSSFAVLFGASARLFWKEWYRENRIQ